MSRASRRIGSSRAPIVSASSASALTRLSQAAWRSKTSCSANTSFANASSLLKSMMILWRCGRWPWRADGSSGSQSRARPIAAIGVGHGRTLAACVGMLPRMDAPELKLVSLLGGMTRRYVTTPFDVIHRLAERTNAAAYVLPLPFFANTAEDKTVFLEQRGVADVFDLGIAATLRFVGVGTLERRRVDPVHRPGREGGVRRSATPRRRRRIARPHVFSARRIDRERHFRTRSLHVGPPISRGARQWPSREALSKIDAIRAVLGSELLHGLITDERTARALAK